MPGGAAAGPGGTEADEETTAGHHDHAAHAQEGAPVEQLARHEAREIADAECGERGVRLRRDGDGGGAPEQDTAHEAAGADARDEDEIPQAGATPVGLEERDPSGAGPAAHGP